jgi:hypothetical protein
MISLKNTKPKPLLVHFLNGEARVIRNVLNYSVENHILTYIDGYKAEHKLEKVYEALHRFSHDKKILRVQFPSGFCRDYDSPSSFLAHTKEFKVKPSMSTIYKYIGKGLEWEGKMWFFDSIPVLHEVDQDVNKIQVDVKDLPQAKPVDYGYINSWKEKPLTIEKCEKQRHKRDEQRVKNGIYEISCSRCDYTYKVDSTD